MPDNSENLPDKGNFSPGNNKKSPCWGIFGDMNKLYDSNFMSEEVVEFTC